MIINKTNIEGCFEISPTLFKDTRGYFLESYNQATFEKQTGIRTMFVQDNQSLSKKGTLRGLHYQKGVHAQAKLVSVLQGEVLDVAVDLRPQSTTYGKVCSILLNSENKKQLYIPRGCAHGFVTLSAQALFFYKCDNFYNKAAEGGIRYNDPTFAIDWVLDPKDLIISDKDLILPTLKEQLI